MSGFIVGFCTALGWWVLFFAVWAVKRAFTSSLDVGD